MKIAPWILLATVALPAAAQSVDDVQTSGEYRVSKSDTPELSKQYALADATRKALLESARRLRERDDIKRLGLSDEQFGAYVAAFADIQEASSRQSVLGGQTLQEVRIRVQWQMDEIAQRFAALRRDQDAAEDVVHDWRQAQDLLQRLSGNAPSARTNSAAGSAALDSGQALTAFRVKLLLIRAAAARARVEERAVGGRAPSEAGRARAKELAEAARALAPDSADAHAGTGDVLLDAGDEAGAEAEFRQALVVSPDSAPLHTRLANALFLQQQLSDAAGQLQEAIRLDPGSAKPHSDLALVRRSQRNTADALSEYKEALRLNPDFIEAHNGLAVALASEGHLPEAVSEFREIIRIDPDSAIGYYNLGYALADLDRDEESAAALREVIRINPNHYNARYNLAELFRLEGKFDESAKQFREYLRLAPDDSPRNRQNIERARSLIEKFEHP
jgi:tetratricopeptide (TPR) repeat protein